MKEPNGVDAPIATTSPRKRSEMSTTEASSQVREDIAALVDVMDQMDPEIHEAYDRIKDMALEHLESASSLGVTDEEIKKVAKQLTVFRKALIEDSWPAARAEDFVFRFYESVTPKSINGN